MTLKKMRPEHLAMLLRGIFWQIRTLSFHGLVLKGRGARLYLDRRVRFEGLVKIGHYATMDLRYVKHGKIGQGFSLGDFSIFRASGSSNFVCPSIDIGQNVSFGPYCNIGGGFGLAIGENVIAGPYVSIHPEEHGISASQPIRHQQIIGTGIMVGGDCWLGAKSTVLDGSQLQVGTVLGAGTIVAGQQTEPHGIYIGAPARLLRHREHWKDGLQS